LATGQSESRLPPTPIVQAPTFVCSLVFIFSKVLKKLLYTLLKKVTFILLYPLLWAAIHKLFSIFSRNCSCQVQIISSRFLNNDNGKTFGSILMLGNNGTLTGSGGGQGQGAGAANTIAQ
jgi:hypothetical protein